MDTPAPSTPGNVAQRLAALDLGSNSFHLLVAEADRRGWRPVYRAGEKVQLAANMDNGRLDPAAVGRGLACLGRFQQQLQRYQVAGFRAVATQALRCARNAESFLHPAQALLGQAVDVISGEEEGRLVYQAVTPTLPGRNLVVDIGGASTELILGEGNQVERLTSLPIGCINTLRHFPDHSLTATHLHQASLHARTAFYQACGDWPLGQTRIIGCSGTLLAVEQVLLAQSWSDTGIDPQGLGALRNALLTQQHTDCVRFHGLSESRRSVFASGLAVVLGLFEALQLRQMQLSQQALREGILEDLWQRQCFLDSQARNRAG